MKALIDRVREALATEGAMSSEAFEGILKGLDMDAEAEADTVVPADWSEVYVAFVRQEKTETTTVAVLTVWSPLDGPEPIVEAIKKAVTLWVATTEAGQLAWVDTAGDLNVGDLLCEGYLEDDDLVRLLLEEGVIIKDGTIADGDEAWSYDTVLADEADARIAALRLT